LHARRDLHDGDDYIASADGGGGMPRKASALHALAMEPDQAAREASLGRPRPRATVDDSDGDVGKWGVQRRGAGSFLSASLPPPTDV